VVEVEVESAMPEPEPEPEPEPTPAPNPEVEPEVEEAPRSKGKGSKRVEQTGHLEGVEVSLKSLVYLGVPRNSASIKAVQARLVELGHVAAGSDRPGWLGPLTCKSLQEFQAEERVREEYCAGPKTIARLFEGTGAVVVD
jgi:hypothetical protein